MASTLDNSTRITLGILATVLATATGGAFYVSHLDTLISEKFGVIAERLRDIKQALDANTMQVMADGKSLALMEAAARGRDARLDDLEKRVRALESRPR